MPQQEWMKQAAREIVHSRYMPNSAESNIANIIAEQYEQGHRREVIDNLARAEKDEGLYDRMPEAHAPAPPATPEKLIGVTVPGAVEDRLQQIGSVAEAAPTTPINQKVELAQFVLQCLRAGCDADEIIAAIQEGKDAPPAGQGRGE